MNVHEYQGKSLLSAFGVPVLKGIMVTSVSQAVAAAQELEGDLWVVKAQIHAGGRGKGGGVKLAKNLQQVEEHAKNILNMQLITPQTGPLGQKVRRVYIEQGCAYQSEFYISFLVDRQTSRVTCLASTEGGMDVEEIAAHSPEKILTLGIDPVMGFQDFHGRKLAFGLGLRGKQISAFVSCAKSLYTAFVTLDASLIEINPFVLTANDQFVALDAKISFDDNALYRQKNVKDLRDLDEEDPREVEASAFGLNYVKLDGTIGCMVNGAGLAMATMDIIQLHGGSPANFLDVGGGASKEQVTAAFKILLSDPNVQAVLVNIFGGIMRCDVIAQGIVDAARDVHLSIPLVVRLEGTNVDLGKKILNDSGLAIVTAEDLECAAEKVVAAVKKER